MRIIRAKKKDTETQPAKRLDQTRIIRKSELDAQLIAEKILADAKAEAQRYCEQAESETQALRERTLDAAQATATEIRVRAERDASELLTARQEELSSLAVAIARKIVGEEIRSDADTICRIVARCLDEAGQSRRLVLRINPNDEPAIREQLETLRSLTQATLISVAIDETIPTAGCIVETDRGQIDGRLESQLKAIEKGLRSRR